MATLSYTQVSNSVVVMPTLVAAHGGGDSIAPNDNGVLVVKNGSGSTITVTMIVPGNTKYGIANPDPTFAVTAGNTAYIGTLPSDLANPSTGLVDFTYSGVTSLTVGGVQIR
jgi:hypothetical protein